MKSTWLVGLPCAMPVVELTRHLYAFFPHLAGEPIRVGGSTIAEVVDGLEALAPGFRFYVCDERGRLRPHVNVFIGDERIGDRIALSDRVDERARVFILQALSGG